MTSGTRASDPVTRSCPTCGARPGDLCTTITGADTTIPHPTRKKRRP